MITLTEGPLSKFCKDGKYSDLFLMALRQYGMLCIGLYRHVLTTNHLVGVGQSNVHVRLRDDPTLAEATTKRYVITAPPGHFQLLQSDQVRQQGDVSENFILFSRFMSSSNLTQAPSTHLIGWTKVNSLKV